LPEGVYLILFKPDNKFIQYIASKQDKNVQVSADVQDLENVVIKGSTDNEIFYTYLEYLKDKRPKADDLRNKISKAKEENKPTEEWQKELDDMDKAVVAYQENIISKYPNSVTSLLLKSNKEVTLPIFEGSDEEVQIKKYYYYKAHYFDFIDFKHPAVLRTPFLHQKVTNYINKMTPQVPDSINVAIDAVLKKMEHNEDMYRFFLADFVNKYAQMKMVGQDAIYVYLVDQYYSKGKAPWVSEETLQKMVENANDLRPLLIGKKMPDFVSYKEDGQPVSLYSIKSPYTVVIFWAPDCGHCKKIMPSVVDFYSKNKDNGVKLLAVCTKGGEKTKTCWPAIQEKGMQDFINTGDEYQRYSKYFKIKSTPKIFILDENKEILLKDLPAEELDRVYNEILKAEEAEKNKK
jgi:thiol-disulfide isomerase/thioredoxin